MGPIMLDVAGLELTGEEVDMLEHPLVGGVILFSRNYFDAEQLVELVRSIRSSARNSLLIAVDHEGGRVQRFRQGFSAIPAMGNLYLGSQENLSQAEQYAECFGWLMAVELIRYDIDFSFAPVLDINGISDVIGDRSFHSNTQIIEKLAAKFITGMRQAGMKSTGKHFPGHGNVKEDSHIAMPVDPRSKQAIFNEDISVFANINRLGLLDAVMPAHVIYPDVDELPACFSPIWLKEYLRKKLDFKGVVFSDDLSMQGAAQIGNFVERATRALHAGCDMALVCNNSAAAASVLDGLPNDYVASSLLPSMSKLRNIEAGELTKSTQYQNALARLDEFNAG